MKKMIFLSIFLLQLSSFAGISLVPQITVTYPNGPITFYGNTVQNISWTSSDVTNVKIEYTTNNGTNWTTIVTSTPAVTGTYSWSVPNIIGSDCRVKITDVSNSSVSDQSDGLFNILKAKTLTLKAPLAGSAAKSGGLLLVKWESDGISDVKIEYSSNGGTNWSSVTTVQASSLVYSMGVPSQITNGARIRISESGNLAINATSGNFIVFEYPSTINVSKDIVFSGNTESSYRMVGVPGPGGDKVNLFIGTGERGVDWNAYLDTGIVSTDKNAYFVPLWGDLSQGLGFWLLKKFGTVKLGHLAPPASTDAYGICSIQVRSGWNIITNPFEKSVDWSKIILENNLSQNALIHGYNGTWSNPTTLVPFFGYYFYNTTGLQWLKIPYNPNGTLAKISDNEIDIQLPGRTIQLNATRNSIVLSKLKVAIDPASTDDYDTTDYFAPPARFEEVSIAINSPQLQTAYKRLQAESRPMKEGGQSFEIQLSNVSGKDSSIDFSGIENFETEEVYLFDSQLKTFLNIKEKGSFSVPGYVKSRKYALLIGTSSFIEAEKEKNQVEDFNLLQNYPNPFNPSTIITYILKEPSFVNLSVYDISGSLVRKLVDGFESPGYHEAAFDAGNLASGVYIYKLDVKNGSDVIYTSTKKMAFVK